MLISAKKKSFLRGAAVAVPVIFGYFPVGFAYGILAVKAGFSPFTTVLMSYFVYAGSGQFIAVGLVTAGAAIPSIVLTVFVVNLRHLLMSASLTPYLRHWAKPLQAWFGFEMTDETFAVNLGRFSTTGVDPTEAFTINFVCHMAWVIAGLCGAFFGDVIGDMRVFGLDFALPAMFIGLIIPHMRIPRRLLAVALGFAFAIGLSLAGAGQWSVILATVLAASLAIIPPMKPKRHTG